MGIQLLFVVETNKKTNSDWMYIGTTIKKIYGNRILSDVALKPIYMDSKTKYNSKKVVDEIALATKMFSKAGETFVIYCIDCDHLDSKFEDKERFERIASYCKSNNYEVVWFNRDVEGAFLHKKVADSDKRKEAERFVHNVNTGRISIEQSSLKKDVFGINSSNLLLITDKLLKGRE